MPRILVADSSDPDFSLALARVLALKGFGTVGTACGAAEDVWRQVLLDPPALLLLDKRNSIEIVPRLRVAPKLKDVRVLVIAGSHEPHHEVEGAAGYIRSPAPPQTYIQAVREALAP